MIEVYDIGNENWENHGNAVLMPPVARVKMVAGGNYDMTMTHPIDPEGKWEHLVPGAVLRVPVPEERIENAFSGYAADIYRVTAAEAQVRESPVEPTTISYPEWSDMTTYQAGDRVTTSLYWGNKNWRCAYFDANSPQAMVPPYASSWWDPIAETTSGAAVLVTVQQGGELYFVEDVDSTWYKLSTYYGIVGYVKKSQVTFYRHLDPDEVKPRIIKDQLMRITGATVDTKNRRVDVTAQHVSYDLNGTIVQEVAIAQASPAMAIGRMMENLMVPYRGTIATNLTSEDNGTYTDTIKGKSGMYCLLDPDKGIVGTFGAELHRDNWDLFIMAKTETDRGFRLRYRKNMLGVSWARKSDSLINRVVPVAKDEKGESLYLPEKWIDSEDIADYPVIRMEVLNVSGQVGKDKGDGTGDKWTLTDLYDEMRTKAAERFSVDGVDRIVEDVTVDFEMLGDTAENLELKKLEKVLLYDQVGAINETIGLDVALTVTELEWDAVREKIVSLRLSSGNEKAGRNVTGYNVQNKSIGWKKLSDDVPQEILDQVKDIIPEYADPSASRPGVPNTVSQDGYVLKGQGQANKVWSTDADGNPAWRAGGGGNYIPTSEKGAAGGVATLDNGGKVPASELPSYVDDVLEYASRSAFPATGESGKIYVAIDTGKTYRWSGSAYFELSTTAVTDNNPTLAWGQQAKVGTIAGTDLHVTMPANPNTDHYDWSDITNKPATATRWPTWDEVSGKPGSFYTLPLAANGTRGGVQVGFTQSGKNYPVQLSGEKAYVNVPWENTTYSAGTGLSLSGTTFRAIIPEQGNWFKGLAAISSSGVMEIGRYIDFHASDAAMTDRDARLNVDENGYLCTDSRFRILENNPLELHGAGANNDSWIYFTDTSTTVLLGIRRPISSYGPTYHDGSTNYRLIHEGYDPWEKITGNPFGPTSGNWYGNTFNLDNLKAGAVFANENTLNNPVNGVAHILSINPHSNYKVQLAIPYHENKYETGFYIRTWNDDGWKAWKFQKASDSVYSLPLAANGTRGGIQVGYTQSGKNYPVQLDNEKAYVNVPWTDNNTTYSAGKGLTLDGTTFKIITPDMGNWYKGVPVIDSNGVMEIGRYIDFHASDTATTDRDARLNVDANGYLCSDSRFVITGNNALEFSGATANSDTWIRFTDAQATSYIGMRRPLSSYGPTYYDGSAYYRLLHEGYDPWSKITGNPFGPTSGNWYGNTFNLNDLKAGAVFVNSSTVNNPVGDVAYVVSVNPHTNYKVQIAIPYTESTYAGGFYIRTYTDAGWKAWKFQKASDTLTNINGTERHMYVKTGQFDINAQSAKTVSFAAAFPNECVSVVVHPTNSFAGPTSISINSKAKGGFTVYLYSTNGLGGTFLYTAFGY